MSTQSQPPKSTTYTQPQNPISQTPLEQHKQRARHHGDNVPTITRGPQSRPSNSDALSALNQTRKQQQRDLHFAADVDRQYGAEQQPNEGSIAANVEGKNARARGQAGAHAGPVGSALGPGYPASASAAAAAAAGDGGEVRELGRKEEHKWMLGERVGRSPTEPDGDFDGGSEREEEVDAGRAVREGTGSAVVR
ncbi:hypothetical protein BDV32DRAFT_144645 [Aspergillus pseudonomiae]|uniref:Uncharacterized protein n=1 Tax=Aspergillus pseudonomiae TaxID=1506151 RepID=A0A5N7D8Z9_9EURO|nr:uncharacterized protein BDV37DRAFT_284754 [Aspergillus pseudonomiae]KAB8265355.1 hypothetical protein BDV32DRAFT_144645 [Aspergillus pseudonomiae]KAE8402443.1 hypothetical protein BDV37DRAFT_284754 [Aspergillus pseudonomiae]